MLKMKPLTILQGKFEDYGLYTQVEQINKNYLKDHGLDENANLYKPKLLRILPL